MQTMAERAPRAEPVGDSRKSSAGAAQRRADDGLRGSESTTFAYGRMLQQGPAVQRVAAYQAMADRRPEHRGVAQLQNGDGGGGGGGMSTSERLALGLTGGIMTGSRMLINRAQGGTGLGPLGWFTAGQTIPNFGYVNILRNLTRFARNPMGAGALALGPLMMGLFGAGRNRGGGGGPPGTTSGD